MARVRHWVFRHLLAERASPPRKRRLTARVRSMAGVVERAAQHLFEPGLPASMWYLWLCIPFAIVIHFARGIFTTSFYEVRSLCGGDLAGLRRGPSVTVPHTGTGPFPPSWASFGHEEARRVPCAATRGLRPCG